ncbi:hypothetical protein LR392_05825 [Arthrobacter sp. AK04]|jgi:hypothetical protein|uniref:Bacterial Pleckstrin homology domain-containing protein n=1 Tax=Neomicrococcus aestuarii TaxID=556325 RepID=A0A7W8X0K2_9MICC|nr:MULTISPECIES: hypothetical protein [Micrococcaceae]MBB5512943.1 hypothetical protein [Neomicrococcus aestuarii]MCD5341744.1 hypothetical protein [Arthrobacter sp. AK04]
MMLGEDSKPVEFRTFTPLRYRAVLAAVGIAAVSILLAATPWPGLAVLVAAVFVAVMTMSVRIRLDEECLSIRVAGVFATTIPYREISAVSAGRNTGFVQGMGLRILPGGGTGYLVGGPSVRIQCGNTAVFVSCADPQGLVTRIGAHIP